MGAVYRAIDIRLGVPVAIKENCVADPEMRAAFRREAQLLANLRHPSLPICMDFFEVDGGQFLVMEFVEGDDLATLMVNAREPLSNATVEEMAWQLLSVLQYLHEEEGIQHRDIKCHNIKFINGRVYLLDFGIAYGASGEMETVGVGEDRGKYGSKRYSPPEQLKGRSVGPSGDLYSLAATLYYALTNVQPVGAEERLESIACRRGDPMEDVRTYNRAADERMSRAIMLALSLKPEDRPQSAAELRDLMFPDDCVQPKAAGLRRLLKLRLVAELFVLGVFAFILTFALRQPRTPETPSTIALNTRSETHTALTTPTPPVTPTPAPTPTPTEAVDKESRAEQAARLADEVARERQLGKGVDLSKLMRARALNEKEPFIHYLIGDILLDEIVAGDKWAERMPEVLAEADNVLKLTTRSPRSEKANLARSWANFAKAYRNTTQPDTALLNQAVDDANEVLKKHDADKKYDADDAPALTIRASATYAIKGLHSDEQTIDSVLEDFGRVVRLTPKDPQAHANLAGIHLKLAGRAKTASRAEHLELARRGFEKAKAIAPRADFLTDLGDVYFNLRDFKKAGETFRAATEADSTYYPAYTHLADACDKLGQRDSAAAARRQARRLKSNDGGALQLPLRAHSDRTVDGK